jgi:predicted Rossmann-fold nucleotide-binding protein
MTSSQPSKPTELYTVEKLTEGYLPEDPNSITKTFSFKQYQFFKPLTQKGRITNFQALESISKHDATITNLLLDFLYDSGSDQLKKVVGIMGGHSEARSSRQYADVADLSRKLTLKGYMIVTGGGPGMMEAAHLGAYFSNAPDDFWGEIKKRLLEIKDKDFDKIPKPELVNEDGTLKTDEKTVEEIKKNHDWFKFAKDLQNLWNGKPGLSLAISTWEYGQEPVMPFASHYASYFQNSIRESALVRESRSGIIYARGGGGTLREIWQDVEENYYSKDRDSLTPMIFFDYENIWGDLTSAGTKPLDIYSTILRVLNFRLGTKDFSWEDKIVSTTYYKKILNLLDKHTETVRESFRATYKSDS